MKHIIYECGICSCFHPWGWSADCRDDKNRYGDPEEFAEKNKISVYDIEVRSMEERILADDDDMITIHEFVRKQGIRMQAHRVPKRPDHLTDLGRHFRCNFTHTKKHPITKIQRTMGVYFSQGSAHTSDPTVEDVLDCLASDAAGYGDTETFEDWAAEYGYDTDSRSAEKTFRAVKRQSEQLKRFLGEDVYDLLLYKTERL